MGGGGAREGEKNRDREGRKIGEPGAETRMTAATTSMAVKARIERGQDHHQVRSAGAGGGYRARGADEEESADKSAGWSGAESEGLATEAEVTTTDGEEWYYKMRTATAGGTQESGAEERSGDKAAGGGDTRKATSVAANEAGEGGSHRARPELRGRIAGRRGNPDGESLGVWGKEGCCKASGVAGNTQGKRQGVGGGVLLP